MANRAFFRNLYNAQNQHFTNIVRRSGREAGTVASTDHTTKRKRADEEYGVYQPNFFPRIEYPKWETNTGENELVQCLFDQNDRCTIFDSDAVPDFDEPIAPVELQLDPSYEDFRLSPRSMMLASEPPALVQIDTAHMPLEPSSSTPIASCREGQEIPEFPQCAQNECNNEMLSLFDTECWVVNKSRRDLPPSSSQGPTESPALVQMNVMPTLTTHTETSQVVAPEPVTPPSMNNADNASTANPPRNRPFKNVRERRRRADMKNKFMQLYNLCCSKAVAPLTSCSGAEATGLLIPISGVAAHLALVNQEPSKVDILGDAISAFEALDKELSDLRTRNRELKMARLSLS